jgi:hypothetical protein
MFKVMRIFIYCFHVKNQKVKVRMTKLFKIWQLIDLATLRLKKESSQERTQEDEEKKPKKRKRDPQNSLLLSLILPLLWCPSWIFTIPSVSLLYCHQWCICHS